MSHSLEVKKRVARDRSYRKRAKARERKAIWAANGRTWSEKIKSLIEERMESMDEQIHGPQDPKSGLIGFDVWSSFERS